MRSNIILRIEFLAGTDIKDAAIDICALANKLGVNVDAKFNDALLLAAPGSDPDVMLKHYNSPVVPKFVKGW